MRPYFLALFFLAACHKKPAPPSETPVAGDPPAQPAAIPAAPQADHSEAADAVLTAHGEQINNCFQTKALMGVPATGDITLRWSVKADGAVANITVFDSTAHNETIETCLKKAVQSWKYPAAADGKPLSLVHTFSAP